ncbi:MAG: histidine kinase [Bacteroidetes bacterium]|nr:MAG: histidine kinase [Bacteroidota bacterium]
MLHRISTRNKLLLALGLNAVFYTAILYVNLDGENRTLRAVFGKNFGIVASEYLVGAIIIFGWLYLAERIHEQFERWFGEEIISKGGIIPNIMGVTAFAAANLATNHLAIRFIYWLQLLTLDRPDQSIMSDTPYARMSMRFTYANYMIMSLLVYYLLTRRRILHRTSEATLRAEQARKARVEMQYTLLRSQVNPHFLFNSLSTLSTLVQVNADTAERFIDRLSRAYRYMLENRERTLIALQAELDFLQAYAFLIETRFNQKCFIQANVPVSVAQNSQLVPLTLQILIDCILKNNRMSARSPMTIRITADPHTLLVTFQHQLRSEPDHSMGSPDWRTFSERYRMLHPEGLGVKENLLEDGTFRVSIPLLLPAEKPVMEPQHA